MNYKTLNKVISLLEIILGLFLLSIEIRDLSLPSINDYIYDLDLVKYKEDTYIRMLIYAMIFLAGINFFYNKKLYSLLTISFILNFSSKYIIEFPISTSASTSITAHTLPTLVIVFYLYLIIRTYKKKTFINIEVPNKVLLYSIIISIVWVIFYILVEYFLIFK